MLNGILWHDEFVIIEACLVFGGRHVVFLLRIPVRRLFIWAVLPVFLFGLLEGELFGVVFIIGTVRIIIVSGAGIALAGLAVALVTPIVGVKIGGSRVGGPELCV